MTAYNSVFLYASPFIVLAIFLFLRSFTVKAQVSELDDLGILNIIIAFSLSFVFYMKFTKTIPLSAVIEISCTIMSFYLGIFVFSRLLKLNTSFEQTGYKIKEIVTNKENQESVHFFLMSSFIIFALFAGFFAFMNITMGERPDDRLVVAENNRVLDILRNGGYLIFMPLSVVIMLNTKTNYARRLFIIASILIMLSGSKGAIISILFMFMLTRGMQRGKLKTKDDLKLIIPIGFIGVAFGALLLLAYGKNANEAINLIAARLFLSGDLYMFSYVTNSYEKLYDLYNPVTYILHPFLKMVGLYGYKYPMGIMIASDVYGSLNYGPNPHFSILSLIFTHGNLVYASLYCFILGTFTILIKSISIELLHINAIPPIFRVTSLFILFPCSKIFLDIGLYQQNIISVAIVTVLIAIVYEFLNGKYSLNNKQNNEGSMI
jgi:hypothetical protein